MREDPTREMHLALDKDVAQRVATVHVCVAIDRACSVLRHDVGGGVANAIAAGADHARIHIPPGTGEGRGRHGARAARSSDSDPRSPSFANIATP